MTHDTLPSSSPRSHTTLGVCVLLFLLMLPVTAMVPVLSALTVERHPHIGDFARHLFMSANMLGALLAAPLAGWCSDRMGRRTPLILAALAVNALALWQIAGDHAYPLLLALRFVEGCAHITALSLLITLGADHARHGRLGGTMGGVGAAISLGVAIGAPVGGWLGAHDAQAVPLAGAVLSATLCVMAAFVLRDMPALPATARRSPLTAIKNTRALAVPWLFAFTDRLTVGFIVSTFSLYLAGVMHFGPAQIGLTMAIFLLPFSLLTWPAGLLCQRVDSFAMMLAGSALYGIFLIALAGAGNDTLLPLMAAGGIVAALMYAPSLVLTATLAPPGARALALAGFNIAGSAGFALGPLLAGAMVGTLRAVGVDPYTPTFIFFGLCEIVLVIALLPWWRRWRRTSRPGMLEAPSTRTAP